MKKVALWGLLLISSVYADPETQTTQVGQANSKKVELAKLHLLNAWSISKQTTIAGSTWVWQHLPQAPESVKSIYHTAYGWVAGNASTAKIWLEKNTPNPVKDWLLRTKNSCKPAWNKTKQTVVHWFTELRYMYK